MESQLPAVCVIANVAALSTRVSSQFARDWLSSSDRIYHRTMPWSASARSGALATVTIRTGNGAFSFAQRRYQALKPPKISSTLLLIVITKYVEPSWYLLSIDSRISLADDVSSIG